MKIWYFNHYIIDASNASETRVRLFLYDIYYVWNILYTYIYIYI
jgi:hypothetical protein